MNEFLELEYRGLNIMDEISTVEIALDDLHNTIHIYDTNEVVEPEFNFAAKRYEMSNGFFKMARVLYEKRFFKTTSDSVDHWITEREWIFYGSKKSIVKYGGNTVIEIPKEICLNDANHQLPQLYKKYVLRVL